MDRFRDSGASYTAVRVAPADTTFVRVGYAAIATRPWSLLSHDSSRGTGGSGWTQLCGSTQRDGTGCSGSVRAGRPPGMPAARSAPFSAYQGCAHCWLHRIRDQLHFVSQLYTGTVLYVIIETYDTFMTGHSDCFGWPTYRIACVYSGSLNRRQTNISQVHTLLKRQSFSKSVHSHTQGKAVKPERRIKSFPNSRSMVRRSSQRSHQQSWDALGTSCCWFLLAAWTSSTVIKDRQG